MRINVAQLLKGPVGGVRKYSIEEPLDVCDDGIDRPVRGEVTLIRTGRGVLAQAEFDTDIDTECSRCLAVFGCPLQIKFQEEYLPTIDVLTGAPIRLPEDEPNIFAIDEHHELDLSEAVRQYALMTMPMKPLCRENCAGLCDACGANLNAGQCGCAAQPVDHRWQKLLEKTNDKKGTN